jgi:hypothetical protein
VEVEESESMAPPTYVPKNKRVVELTHTHTHTHTHTGRGHTHTHIHTHTRIDEGWRGRIDRGRNGTHHLLPRTHSLALLLIPS